MKINKLIIIIFLLIPFGLFAQKKKSWNKPLYDSYPWHYGYSLSVGVLDFSVDHTSDFMLLDSIYSVEAKPQAIFSASIVGNLRINENWDLRILPGLSFGQRTLSYLVADSSAGSDVIFYKHDMKIESALVQVPILIKYRAVRQNNFRPYVIFGGKYAIDLAARKKIKEEEKPKIRLNRHDVYLVAGFGIDSYLPYFKFSSEISFSYGLINIVNYDNTQFTKVFDRLGSKMVTLSIYFE